MTILRNPILFFTTSPRSPDKMIPEIRLLCEQFDGKPWNISTQNAFCHKLAGSPSFEGYGSTDNKAFSARDRISRAPKALGFVELKPVIRLTEVGRKFVYGKDPKPVFLRQLLKFQLPSPYHKEYSGISGTFRIRPYLEMMRLIYELGMLSLDEIKIFALQLTNYQKYDEIKRRIRKFREKLESYGDNDRKELIDEQWTQSETSVGVKKNTMHDYADACVRYLSFTGLFKHQIRPTVISPLKTKGIEHILQTVDRNPVFLGTETAYKEYLFNPAFPSLLSGE